jgi:2-polyprenyl-6-methoxyphenol hydroxylase-like FAD-dependent oxidoreductase
MDVRYGRIVVLGGGTAGWMAALALATGLPRSSVTLVESEEVGIVGVGEATFPSIRAFHDIVGVDEARFLRATNGTFKLGIQFCDWRERGSHYYHTFGDFGPTDGPNTLWGQYRRLRMNPAPGTAGAPGAFGEQCLPTVMAMHGRFCPPAPEQGAHFNYAYHFDATLYSVFLRDMAVARGVQRLEGKVVDVARRPDGAVASLRLADGRDVAGDLFIDCSGFASLLLGRTLGEPFVDYSRWLPVDRAWACPAERRDDTPTPVGPGASRCRIAPGTATCSRPATSTRTAPASSCWRRWTARRWPSRVCCALRQDAVHASGSATWSHWGCRRAFWSRSNRPASTWCRADSVA